MYMVGTIQFKIQCTIQCILILQLNVIVYLALNAPTCNFCVLRKFFFIYTYIVIQRIDDQKFFTMNLYRNYLLGYILNTHIKYKQMFRFYKTSINAMLILDMYFKYANMLDLSLLSKLKLLRLKYKI